MELIAYHGSQEIKDKFVNRMIAHIEADELIQGTGFEDGRGCAVGCTLDGYDHGAYPTELGMPEWVAHLNDRLHESTSKNVWPTLQLRFLKAVKPGITFDSIRHKLLSFIQARNIERVQSLEISEELKSAVIESIQAVKDLHDSECIDDELWSAAESAARSAARSAESAESAAWSAARSAESAAWSAESAESAARSAAWSAESAESAARSAARSAESAESAARSAESAESAARSAESAESAARSAAWSAARSAARSAAEYDAIAEKFIQLVEAA